jgi:hypothetical protein
VKAKTNPPPLTRGVTTLPEIQPSGLKAGLDWLQYSVEWPHEITSWPILPHDQARVLQQALPPCRELIILGEVVQPLPGYNHGTTATHARLFWHDGRREQHIGVVMTGEDMRGMIGIAYPQKALLDWVVMNCTAISRMDMAIDIHDSAAKPWDVLAAWDDGRVFTPASTVTEINSYTHRDDGETEVCPTLYIGSRSSDRQLRIYDKAKQMGIAGPWIRIELQLRHERALNIAKAALQDGLKETAQAAIRAFCKVDGIKWWDDATNGPAVDFDPIGRRDTNTEKWLYDQVMPTIRKTIETQRIRGEDTLLKMLRRVIIDIGDNVND